MKPIFKTTGAKKDRTLVRARANAIGLDLTSASLPAIVEQSLEGKTILVVVKDSEVKGVFNRLGQEYPIKAKQSKSGEVWATTVMKGFTPSNCGVYVAQLVAEGLTRTKIKAIVSLTRSAKFSKPEQEILESKLKVVITDFFTLDEFNEGGLKPLLVRKTTLDKAMSCIKAKKFPQFKVAEYVECNDIKGLCAALVNFGGGFVRKVPAPAKETKAETKPQVEHVDNKPKKSGDSKPSKKDKKAKKDKVAPSTEKKLKKGKGKKK